MDTKHINDPLDRTALEVKALSVMIASSDAEPDQQGPAVLRLVENPVSEVAEGTDQEEVGAPAAAEPAAKNRGVRFEALPHRLAGRTVPKRRRR